MATFHSTLTAEYVRDIFDYYPDTGIMCRKSNPGVPVGNIRKDGYLNIKCKGKTQLLHKIVWLHYYGSQCDGFIDHKNRIRTDNRIENLSQVSRKQNNENKSLSKGKTLPKGVYFRKDVGKFVSAIGSNYKIHHLGYFSSAEEAKLAYEQAASKLHTNNRK